MSSNEHFLVIKQNGYGLLIGERGTRDPNVKDSDSVLAMGARET